MSLTLHLNCIKEDHPQAVVAQPKERGEDAKLKDEYLSGDWLRVFPQTARDVKFLLMLEHQLDKFAPSSGIGVLVAARCLDTTLRS